MIYITGDTHAEYSRFNTKNFPEQQTMTRDDYVIVCGDFGGVWYDNATERYWLNWLAEKNFTLLYVDGNHENFDRLNSVEFETVDFHGGKAHKIRDNIFHLMRGHVFNLHGKKFFAFGGASSHDIQDGILDPANYASMHDCVQNYRVRTKCGQMLRINHLSWWKEELPNEEEMERGKSALLACGNKVDYVISHSLPQNVCGYMGYFQGDAITEYFDHLVEYGLRFKEWHCGHFHREQKLLNKYQIHYQNITKLM